MCISAGYFQAVANFCITFPIKGIHMTHIREIIHEEMNRTIQIPSKIKTGSKKSCPCTKLCKWYGGTGREGIFYLPIPNAFQQHVLISPEIRIGQLHAVFTINGKVSCYHIGKLSRSHHGGQGNTPQ